MQSLVLLRPRCAFAYPAALLALAASAGAAPPAALRAPQMPNLPLTFEKNTGHWPGEVQFVARYGQGTLFLTKREMVVSLRKGDKATALRLKLQGSNPKAVASGLEKRPGIVNYFIGNDPKKWRTKVPTYSRARLAGVYPGVDLVYYGAGRSRTLEYDFVVKPGADPKRIRMTVSGARSLRTVGGKLIASTPCGDVTLNRPYAYQTVNGVRKQVACTFTLERNTVAFQVARYDASRPLVVDPTLIYSTYLGGNADDYPNAVAVDAAGATYVAGGSRSTNFPTTAGAYDTSWNGGARDGFVTKLNAAGTSLVYSTYLGGSGFDNVVAVSVNATGVACVAGTTGSSEFPTTSGAYLRTLINTGDLFVAKLNATGTALVYSTFLGSSADTNPGALAVDAAGAAYVAGYTSYTSHPTTAGAFDTSINGATDAFVTKLNAAGTALVYSTFLGGSGNDSCMGLAVDSTGAAYLVGDTYSANFPTTTGTYDTSYGNNCDGFVTKLNAAGTALVYSTYLGGTGGDHAYSVAVDTMGAAYVAGYTFGADFPTTTGAYDTTQSGGDAFVTKLNAAGTGLAYSTFVGGSSFEAASSVAVDATGAACIAGYTTSASFPTTSDAFDTSINGATDAFVTKLNAAGTGLVYSTFLGGTDVDEGKSVALDTTGAAYVFGYTYSTDFPSTSGAFDTSYNGGSDLFVSKLMFPNAAPTTITADAVTCYGSDTITLTGTLTKTSDSSALAGKTIQFKIDAGGTWTNASAATGADGKATLSATAPATTGAHTIYVRFEGDTDYVASDGSNTLTVKAPDATTLTVDNKRSRVGVAVTLTATLARTTGGAGISGKTLEFRIGAAGPWTAASAATGADGKASASLTAPAAAGSHAIEARFAGDTHDAVSSGSGTLETVVPQATVTVCQNRTCGMGDPIELLAYLWRPGGIVAVTGKTLQFRFNGGAWNDAPAVTQANGKSVYQITAPAVAGVYPVEARFAGDVDDLESSGSATLTVTKRATYITAPERFGDAGTTVNIAAILYHAKPNGDLVPLSGKTVTLQIPLLSITRTAVTAANGSVSIPVAISQKTGGYIPFTVAYAGDDDYQAFTQPSALDIKHKTLLTVVDRSAGRGDKVTLSANLVRASGAPLGGKTLYLRINGGSWLATAPTQPANGRGNVDTVVDLPAGTYTIDAKFDGDADEMASTGSGALTVTAKAATYCLTAARTAKQGTSVNLGAYVYRQSTMAPLAGKPLNYYIDGTKINASALITAADGKATCVHTLAETVGAHNLVVKFEDGGDPDYAASQSAPVTVTITP